VSCGGFANAVTSGYNVTLTCKGSISGTWTHTNWRLNGKLLEKYSNNKVLSLDYTFPTTQLEYYTIEFEACNQTACVSAFSQTIDVH
jgi:hypothetical protein